MIQKNEQIIDGYYATIVSRAVYIVLNVIKYKFSFRRIVIYPSQNCVSIIERPNESDYLKINQSIHRKRLWIFFGLRYQSAWIQCLKYWRELNKCAPFVGWVKNCWLRNSIKYYRTVTEQRFVTNEITEKREKNDSKFDGIITNIKHWIYVWSVVFQCANFVNISRFSASVRSFFSRKKIIYL